MSMVERIVRIDDLDRVTEGAATVYLTVEGVDFEVDCAEESKKRLLEALRPFLVAGRRRGTARVPEDMKELLGEDLPAALPVRANGQPAARTAGATLYETHSKADLAKVREWAAGYRITLGNGRVPADVWEAWESNDVTRLRKGRLPA
jgi:hypothetical protein